ncbi:MAG: hypothetical protein QNJ36_14740 [Calothrix sp. MO_167.B42]|nr:hypothetical protein [Calothrix sp. MO_167.B42]
MESQDNKSQELQISPAEQEKQEELMRDVLVLMENLIYQEEATVKLVIDCLYDIGTVNLINQKFRSRTFNKTLKLASRVSKPAFKVIAWRLVRKKSPQLITNWLGRKVAFERAKPQVEQAELVVQPESTANAIAPQNASTNILPPAQYQIQEVKYLRSQVKMLVSVIIGIVTVFGGSFFWMNYQMQRSYQQTIQEIQTQMKIMEANREPR